MCVCERALGVLASVREVNVGTNHPACHQSERDPRSAIWFSGFDTMRAQTRVHMCARGESIV